MLLRKKEEIEAWLNQYQIIDYELIDNEEYGYVVNVNTHINLYNKNLKSIDVKFNQVKGNFSCSYNHLTSLEGCPKLIKKLFCTNNKLTIKGLKFLPKEIKENYIDISKNKELEEFQNINNFNELKEKVEEIFKIKKEKNNLLNIINTEKLNKNKSINKL